MFSPTVLVIALLGIATATEIDIQCPAEGQSFYSHPNYCAKFLECNNGELAEMECFGDFIFNPEIGFCDFPENVDCVDQIPEEPQNPSGPVGTCPELNGKYVDFLTDAGDCGVFYMCNWGTPIKMECPADLHFNPAINVCDFPYRAGCKVGQ